MTPADMFYISGTIGIWAGLILVGLIVYHLIKIAEGIRRRIDQVESGFLAVKTTILGSLLSILTSLLESRGGGKNAR